MGRAASTKKTLTVNIGSEPIVLVPLKLWREIEECLEDREALASKPFIRRVQKSRAELAAGKIVYPFR